MYLKHVFPHSLSKINLCSVQSPKLYSTTRRNESLTDPNMTGLILGVYENGKYSAGAQAYSNKLAGKLESTFRSTGGYQKYQTDVLHFIDPQYHTVVMVGMGPDNAVEYNPAEDLNEKKENVRVAAAIGSRVLHQCGVGKISIDDMGEPESVAEGAGLTLWTFQENNSPSVTLHGESEVDKAILDAFDRGLMKAQAQNIARQLSDAPANLMTPFAFTEAAAEVLCKCGVNVVVREKAWAEENGLEGFLHVAKGSCEPPLVLEMSYCGRPGADGDTILLVGKGATFDAGGLNLKKCQVMSEMRADMAGAAVIVGALRAIAALKLPINVNAVVPLCENMMSGQAMRPGDVVLTKSGKTVWIGDTDNEGRIVVADAISYGMQTYTPKLAIDISTFSYQGKSNLGCSSSAVFTNNSDLWEELKKAGATTGDRVWRMPMWRHFKNKLSDTYVADLRNSYETRSDDMCYAAAFIKEFVTCTDFIHMDIGGPGMVATGKELPYLEKNHMTGRPTRTLIQFLYQLSNADQKK